MIRRIVSIAAAAAGAAALLTTPALASTPAPGAQPAGQPVNACVKPSGVLDYLQFQVTNFGNCAKGDNHWTWGLQGPAGPAGPTGPQGPSGVVSAGTHTIVSAPASIATGGSFSAKATDLPTTVQLGAGTYLISLNAQAEPNATASGAIFPQFFVYNGTQKADFSNDLFNVGAGELEPFIAANSAQHDSYYSGSTQITVPAGGATINLYAFGYDSDSGASTYNLITMTFTATQITPAS
jgi:hypothetical protein